MINAFLDMMASVRGASENTLLSYAHDLTEVDQFVSRPLEQATVEDLQSYLADCVKRDLSARTQARRVSALRRYFRFLVMDGIREDNPAKAIDLPRIGRSLPKDLSEDEITKLLKGCDQTPLGLRMRAMMELLYASGLRVSELLGLKTTSLVQEKSALHISGKGNKDRIVPLHPIAQEALDAYLKIRSFFMKNKTDLLFPSKRGASPTLSRDAFFKALKQHAVNCGVDPMRVSPHAFRHSFASHLLRGGADLRSVQALLGHEDLATTEIYTHIIDDELKKEVFTKHPLAKKGSV
ncbi:MAG: site-specific tyrosine recombinase XerD [Alphaproteobacteria bacterium]|nr:site-specific tyrosine recombinase XerD [Alphaproteobacteria bacterium]